MKFMGKLLSLSTFLFVEENIANLGNHEFTRTDKNTVFWYQKIGSTEKQIAV